MNTLRLDGSDPICIYPDDFIVWLSAVPMEEVVDLIGEEAFNKLIKKYESELEEDTYPSQSSSACPLRDA